MGRIACYVSFVGMCENYCALKKDKCYFVIFPKSVANMRRHINLYPNICEIIKVRAALRDDNKRLLRSIILAKSCE